MQAWRVTGRVIAVLIVVVWLALDVLFFIFVRPIVEALSRLALFKRIGAVIGRLPPYGVLVLLAIPFVLVEPLKVVALYWIATGLVIRGVLLLIASYFVSILTLDSLYKAGEGQLMKIGWFARLVRWIVELRDWALGWVRSTAAWQWAAARIASIRAWARTLVRPVR
jgi:hypothetical protein